MVQHFLARWKGMFFLWQKHWTNDRTINVTTDIEYFPGWGRRRQICQLVTKPLYPFSPTAAAVVSPHSLTTGNNLPSRIPTESIFARKTLQYNCWDWEECAWWALVSSLASTAHLIALACVGEQQTITQVLWRSHSALLLQRRQIWRTETRSGFQWLWCGNLPCSWLLGGFKHFSSQRHRSTV